MTRSTWGRSACLLLLVAAACWLPPRAWADSPPSGERIEKLIEQLDAQRFAKREEASKKLIASGRAAVGPLRKALAAGGLSLEAATRARAILDKLYVPPCGAVWRSSGSAEEPEGLHDGDVVTEAAGGPVWSQDDLLYAVSRREPVELTVWRKDKGRFKTTTVLDAKALRRLRTYPDELALFEQFGRKGPWEQDVRKGLGKLRNGDPGYSGLFEKAWKAGCRDPVVLAVWIGGLVDAGKHREALKLAAREAPKARRTDAGGRVLHGLLPYAIAKAHRAAGRRAEALATLEAAAGKALDAKASSGLSLLRAAQVEFQALDSPKAAVKLLRDHADQLASWDLAPTVVRETAEALSGGGDPNAVLAFLELVKESPAAPRLREAYEPQVPLAAKSGARKDRKPTAILVHWRRGLLPARTTGRSTHTHYFLVRTPPPCRIECEVRLDALSEERVALTSRAGMALWAPRGGGPVDRRIAEICLARSGRAYLRSIAPPVSGISTAFVGSPRQWHRMGIDLAGDRVRFRIDGRVVRTWYGKLPSGIERVEPVLVVADGRAHFRNVKRYVFTAADVDGGRVEAAMTGMHEAMLAGDRRAAARHHRTLQDLWAKVPEAKPYVEAPRRAMALYERLFSPGGLQLCTSELLNDPAVTKKGTWRLDDGWLVGTPTTPGRAAIFDLPLLTPDIEITGLLDMDKGGQAGELLILWDGQSVRWARNYPRAGNPHMKYLPPYAKIYVGGWWDREKGKKLPGEPPLGPMPFCLRIRGDKVALFAGDPAKPIIFFSGVPRNPAWFSLTSFLDGPDGKAKYGRIVIRHLPKDKDLRAPAELPETDP